MEIDPKLESDGSRKTRRREKNDMETVAMEGKTTKQGEKHEGKTRIEKVEDEGRFGGAAVTQDL